MRAGIALGSNLEPRLPHLQAAKGRLLSLHSDKRAVVFCSKVYETSPVDCAPGTRPFLNAVMEISTNLSPAGLLMALHGIEEHLGRPAQREKNSPRTIDLDILYYNDEIVQEGDLVIPHPRIAERRFVLQPLADIRPDLVLPTMNKNIGELLAALPPTETVEVYCNAIY
jgi:2-amino-4-hydroxy-6-hydroxymethyldihydropteridine diphosphokinase